MKFFQLSKYFITVQHLESAVANAQISCRSVAANLKDYLPLTLVGYLLHAQILNDLWYFTC